MIKTIKHAINKNAWLFLAAAWVYTLSFIFTNYLSYSSSAEKVARILGEYMHGQERSFKILLNDSIAIHAIISDASSPEKERLLTDAQGIFAYQINKQGNPVEIYWNTNKMSVAQEDLSKPDGSYILNYQNGIFEFVKASFVKQNTNYVLVTLIPLYWNYFMQNEYLKPHFAVNEELGNAYEISDAGDGAPVTNSAGKTLFSIREKHYSYADTPVGLSVFLRVVALLCLFIFINNVASETARRDYKYGLAFLLLSFLILRLLIFFFRFPFNYLITPLFSPDNYNDGYINRSLGDLLLNVVIILWIILFLRKKAVSSLKHLRAFPVLYRSSIYSSFIVIPLLSFYIGDTVSGLVIHSSISFSAANFFSLSIYSLIGFIIICMLLYIWLFVTGLLVKLASIARIHFFWQCILIAACSFLLISIRLFFDNAALLLFITLIVLLLVTFIRYRNNPSFTSLVKSPYFIVWALLLTASVSALIVYQISTKEKNLRIKTAKDIQEQTDSSGTFLIRIALNNFSDQFLQNNFYRFKNPYSNKFIKDSLVEKNLNAYLTKYNTKVYVFDQNNRSLYNEDSASYLVIKSVLENKSKPSFTPGLYFYRDRPDSYNYIYEKKIFEDSAYLGSVFVWVQPRINEDVALVPELFRQTNDISSLTESGYIFGVYDNRKLVTSFTGFNFSDSVSALQIPRAGYYYKDSLGYSQLWYNAGANKLLIIVKKDNWFFNFITLFSYLFVLFIVLAFMVHSGRRALNNKDKKINFDNLFRFTIRTQIQATIIGVSFVSFLIIGIATISFFILRYTNSTDNQLIRNSRIIAVEIEQVLKEQTIPADILNINDIDEGREVEKKIMDIATVHNTDINFYARNGALLVSSQPYIYAREVLSGRIDPRAFYELHYNQSTRFLQEEKIGNFTFKGIYTPVKNEKDETIAYLNIPLLGTKNELKEEISDFLVTLIILNALIFIFAGAIAVSLTGRIASSLELIGRKMKQIKIGAANEEITWKDNDDEIGMLVSEYNKMVKELGESAEALARSEREGAWREMARQVAHEIKNPLTPMKLSIQYLQRAMEEGKPNTVELSKKLASTLIEQIDQLSKIAGDFSQFANIENVQPQRFNITELLQNLVNLYNTDSNLSIGFTASNNDVEVFLDKAQINRLFTNLMKNAIEASEELNEGQINRIQIKQYTKDDNVIISITDHGSGINESLRTKIFNPNFTTKTSGTGLGLAICKAIVENAGGKIWFATSPGEGTTFYVDLPLTNGSQPLTVNR